MKILHLKYQLLICDDLMMVGGVLYYGDDFMLFGMEIEWYWKKIRNWNFGLCLSAIDLETF